VKFWSPSTSEKLIPLPPKKSPPEVTPTAMGGAPSTKNFSKVLFFRLFSEMIWWLTGGTKSMTGPSVRTIMSAVISFTGSSMGSR
jgi:hypothetical protein